MNTSNLSQVLSLVLLIPSAIIGFLFLFKTKRVLDYYNSQAVPMPRLPRLFFYWWAEYPNAALVVFRVIGGLVLLMSLFTIGDIIFSGLR